MTGATAATHKGMKAALGATGDYHYLQFNSSLALDETNPVKLKDLTRAAHTLKNTPAFGAVVNCLSR